MTEHVATDVESVDAREQVEELANTTGSLKVIITKQGEEGEGS